MTAVARHENIKKPKIVPISSRLAVICKALADSLRLDIMRVLSNDSFGVQELATIFSMPQPGMSHHLKILAKSGLLVTRRQGNSIFYRRALLKNDSEFYEFQASLFTTISAWPLAEEYVLKIQEIYGDRSAQSRLYFERNLDKFEENQDMLCELSQYLPNLREILDLLNLSSQSQVMEIGPGQGELLVELAKRFDKLVALDSSEKMLTFTRNNVAIKDNINFIQSSLEDFDPQNRHFDMVVLNMVLHHMSSPRQTFQKLKQMVRQDGFVLLADLCSHNQEWTRDLCGDVWLGFDPLDLKDWAISAGFIEDQSLYLGLKNGFQIQLKLFRLGQVA